MLFLDQRSPKFRQSVFADLVGVFAFLKWTETFGELVVVLVKQDVGELVDIQFQFGLIRLANLLVTFGNLLAKG